MSSSWDPAAFHDSYRDDVMALIKKKIKSRQTHVVAEADETVPETGRSSANVIDLMALLKKSLDSKGKNGAAPKRKTVARPVASAAKRTVGARGGRA
jgi:DNA end-binding protein Ku